MRAEHVSASSYRTIGITRIAGALGAEIRGVDLRRAPAGEQLAEIRRAWLEHLVIVFREQTLDADAFMAFARAIGKPVEYPFVRGIDGYPEIIEVKKLAHETVNFGGVWHSDTTYLDCPPMASMLLAREVPPFGGDTLFANACLAYETLSPGLRATLDGLTAISSSAQADVSKTREDRIRSGGREDARTEYMAEHPVVRTHPETSRRALYVNVAHTTRFAGWSEDESRGLLQFLFAHLTRPEFTCRLAWQPGTLALWDNRCAQHNPVNDYHGHQRLMHRITLEGERPR